MSKRRSISKRIRFLVLERDGFCCRYCGAKPPDVRLHIDHRVPVATGGDNSAENLVTACEPCNLGKAAHELEFRLPNGGEREYSLAADALLGLVFFGGVHFETPMEVIKALETLADGFASESDGESLYRRLRRCSSWEQAHAELYRDFPGGCAANDCGCVPCEEARSVQ